MIKMLLFLVTTLLQIPMADTFRADGKIYVVVAVILIIVLGMIFYLFRLDKKIKELEDEQKNKKE